MIKITIELVPGGIGKPRHLGTMKISNLSGLAPISDYEYRIFNKARHRWRSGIVKAFPRKRLLVWDLLYRILRKEFGERNEK